MEYKINEVAVNLGVHENTVRHWLRTGKLQGYKLAGSWRIPEENITKMINEAKEKYSNGEYDE